MADEQATADDTQRAANAVVNSTPPVGVSSNQIFIIALVVLALYAVSGIAVIWKGDASERTAFEQSSINLALLAAGFYLGSSASSRNNNHAG